MDLDFFFDINDGSNVCSIEGDKHNYLFQKFDERFLQFVMSDRVVNCFLQAMEEQDMFHFKINTDWIMRNLGSRAM